MEVALLTEMDPQVEDLLWDTGTLRVEITKAYPLSEVTREVQGRDLLEATPLEEDPVMVLTLRRKSRMTKGVKENGN